MDRVRDEHPAGIGQCFDPCRDIDAVAKDVAGLDDDVTDVDADAELDAVFGRHARVMPGHLALHLDGAAQCIDHAAELDEQPVAGGLDETTLVLGDFRVDHLAAQGLEAAERSLLVGLDQPRIAGDIGGKDRRETAVDASWPGGLHDASSVAVDPTRMSRRHALSMAAKAVPIPLLSRPSTVAISLFRGAEFRCS
jgi:hypothetical protein